MSFSTEVKKLNSFWTQNFTRHPRLVINDEEIQYSGDFKIVSDGDPKMEEVVGNKGDSQTCESTERPAGSITFGLPSNLGNRAFVVAMARSKEKVVAKAFDDELGACLTLRNARFEALDETTLGNTSIDVKLKGSQTEYTTTK